VGCTGSSLCEAWDGDTCAIEGWTVTNIADCAVAAIGCGGAYEAVLTNDGTSSIIVKAFTETTEVFAKFDFRFNANVQSNPYLTRVYDNGVGGALDVYIRNDDGDKIRVYHGAVNAVGNTVLAPDTWYTLKFRYVADPGGGNGQGWIWLAAGQQKTFDTTCTVNCEAKIVNGTDVQVPDRFYLYSADTTAQSNFIYDNIWVGTTDPDA